MLKLQKIKALHGRMMLIGAFLMLFVFGSCTDDPSMPSDTKTRNIKVIAGQTNALTKNCDPVKGAEIKIYSLAQTGERLLTTLSTDTKGMIDYLLTSPVYGDNMYVTGYFNKIIRKTKPFLLCRDTVIVLECFPPTPPIEVDCSTLSDKTINVPFADETGDTILVQNTPPSVDQTVNLFCNGSTSDINVTFPSTLNTPFSVKTIYVDNESFSPTTKQLTLKPGACLSIEFSVSTAAVGTFTATFLVDACNPVKVWTLNLRANVKAFLCDCKNTKKVTYDWTNDYTTTVNASQAYPEVKVFTNNNQQCSMIVTGFDWKRKHNAWSIGHSNPSINIPIAPGESFYVTPLFAPKMAAAQNDTLIIHNKLDNNTVCSDDTIIFIGKGCIEMCPILDGNVSWGSKNPLIVSRTFTFAPDGQCVDPNTLPKNIITITVSLPDSACNAKNLYFNVTNNELNLFELLASTITVEPGQTQQINVLFHTPTVSEFNLLRPGPVGQPKDSSFHFSLSTNTCNGTTQNITLNINVGDAAAISDIQDLYAYNQHTYGFDNTESKPDYKVCYFETRNNEFVYLASLENPKGTGNAPRPEDIPSQATLYVGMANPADTALSGTPPQVVKNPSLFLVAGNSYYKRIKLFKTRVSPTDFANKQIMTNYLLTDYSSGIFNFSSGYSDRILNLVNISPSNTNLGDVYILYNDATSTGAANGVPCNIAMIYIVRVDNGSNNAEGRCGINFRVMAPIYLPQ